jgi:predicted dehydrogenase
LKNVGIVGFGPHGKRLMDVIMKIPELKLVGIADINKNSFNDENLDNIKQYSDFKELSKDFELDLLVITTNGPSHFEIAEYAIKRGIKRLFISKPLTTILSESKKLIKLAKKYKVRIAVDFGFRHDKTYSWIRSKIQSGIWGHLRSVYIMKQGIGLGCLGLHSFDLMNSIVGDKIHSVAGWVDKTINENPRGKNFIDPGGLVIINYYNGIRGVISQIEDGSGPMSVEINLTGARINIDEKFGYTNIVIKDHNSQSRPNKPVSYKKVELPSEYNIALDIYVLMKSIIIDLLNDGPLKSDMSHGKEALEILVAAYLSNESNHVPIKLPITDDEALNRFFPIT